MYQPVSSRIVGYLAVPKAYTCDFVQRLATLIHRPPHVVANAIILFVGTVLLLNPGGHAEVLSQLLTFLPGLWGTFKCFRDPDPQIYRKWLDYWVIYSSCVAVEACGIVIALFPLWWLTKVFGLYWMLNKEAETPRHKPEPLTLKTKTAKIARRPPTPIALESPRHHHEPLPISAITQPEVALPHTVAQSLEPRRGRVTRGTSPVPRVPSTTFALDITPESSPSPPFELSSDGSAESLPRGDFFFDDLATAVEPQSDDDVLYIDSARSRTPHVQTAITISDVEAVQPEQRIVARFKVPVAKSADMKPVQVEGQGKHGLEGPFKKPAEREPVKLEQRGEPRLEPPVFHSVDLDPQLEERIEPQLEVPIFQMSDPQAIQSKPRAERGLEVPVTQTINPEPILEQHIVNGLEVNEDLDASPDHLLQLAAKEDEEMTRTGDEEDVAKGSTKPLSLFEKRVRRHNTLLEDA